MTSKLPDRQVAVGQTWRMNAMGFYSSFAPAVFRITAIHGTTADCVDTKGREFEVSVSTLRRGLRGAKMVTKEKT